MGTDVTSAAPSARRLAMEEARRSKRPSRGDRRAGTTGEPDRVLADAGFTDLLRRTLVSARAAAGLPATIDTLMTLNGHLPAESAWRAISREEAVAIRVLTRDGRAEPADDVIFTSALALNPQGKLVVTVPGRRELPPEAAATGVAARVPWSAADLVEFQRLMAEASAEAERELTECRALLAELGAQGRAEAVDALRSAVFLIPPVLFFQGDTVYSNLREEPGNLTGKTLLPSHPDCFFHHLDKLPFELWTDAEIVVVACLWLLYLSGGPNRLESSNGFQLTLRNVTDNLCAQNELYARAGRPAAVTESLTGPVTASALSRAAEQLAVVRADLVERRGLYYEINATTRRKAENTFGVVPVADNGEHFLCGRLQQLLPGAYDDLPGFLRFLRANREWLAEPVGGEPSGLEAVIYTTVVAVRDYLNADFAMSRGMRSLPKLIDALATRDWKEIVSWELPAFYCCVVPSAAALKLFDGDHAALSDSSWAIAARMQYNTWHVMPGNLPKDPAVTARDFLAPHALPDLAVHSNLHHRGHVTHNIRFSARSPETVRVAGIPFKSLTDIRALRCEGPAFVERELHTVTRLGRFVAQVCELVAETAADGLQRVEVTSFDHRWYRETIINARMARHD